MTTIQLTTQFNVPVQEVFNLSRNINFHIQSASKTDETVIAGIATGLINLNETVTWRGKHFGFYLTHKSRITEMVFFSYFVDEMEDGNFKSFKHEHFFEQQNGVTIMTDQLYYETPFGIFGKLFDYLFLKKHLTTFLLHRNKALKQSLEIN